MAGKLKIEVLRSWGQAAQLQTEWNNLHNGSQCGHPFTTYEWFDCWYPAFCEPENVAIIVVRDESGLRSILPGMLLRQRIGGIPLNIFSYAGNGHSPRCGIISKRDDSEAIRAAIKAIWNSFRNEIILAIFMGVDKDSSTYNVLSTNNLPHLTLHIEHSFKSPAFDLSKGWESYLASRSKNFRHRVRQGRNQAKRMGGLKYDIISSEAISENIIERLKLLEAKTWQHKSGSGLFSTLENERFYYKLLRSFGKEREITLCFQQIGDKDSAYELSTSYANTAFFLKYGYDSEFGNCHPGLLIQSYLSEYVSSLGFNEVDLLGEMSEEKERWQTHLREHRNYWIINKKAVRGEILFAELRVHNVLKRFTRMLKHDKTLHERSGNMGAPSTGENKISR